MYDIYVLSGSSASSTARVCADLAAHRLMNKKLPTGRSPEDCSKLELPSDDLEDLVECSRKQVRPLDVSIMESDDLDVVVTAEQVPIASMATAVGTAGGQEYCCEAITKTSIIQYNRRDCLPFRETGRQQLSCCIMLLYLFCFKQHICMSAP
jgi:hypothetical protein